MNEPTIHVVGDAITDEYILVEHIGTGDEGISPRYRHIDRSLRRGGASFVNDCLWDQSGPDLIPYLKEIHYAGDYYITRYMTEKDEPNSIFLTYESEQSGLCDGLSSFKNWKESDFIVLWDCDRSYNTTTTLKDAYSKAKEIGATIIVDCSSPDILERYPDADIYKINSQEFTAMHELGYPDFKKSLLIVTGPIITQVTGTYRGYWELNFRVEPTVTTDTIGAGDVFLSRLTYLLASGEALDYAVREAGKFATESTKHFGCYFPTELL